MREWARLRYGVFEEHGEKKEGTKFPMLYKPPQSQEYVPNICSDKEPILFDPVCKDDVIDSTTDSTTDSTDDPQSPVHPLVDLPDYSQCDYTLRPEYNPASSILSDPNMLKTVNSY